MSSKAKGQNKKTSTPELSHDERWRSGRSRFGVQHLRLGRDKKWHFVGQLPDETVVKIMREHWWFLVKSALPLFVVLVALILIIWGSGKLASPIWPFLKIIAGVAILGALAPGAPLAVSCISPVKCVTYPASIRSGTSSAPATFSIGRSSYPS